MFASEVSSRQIQFVPQKVGECESRLNLTTVFTAIDGYRDFAFHGLLFKMAIRNAQQRRVTNGK
jgi:hypothetical protein